MINNKKIHIIGVGGICMSGIAKFFLEKNFFVSGSDLKKNELIEKLEKFYKFKFYLNHNKYNIKKDLHFITYSSSIKKNNVEIKEAKKYNIPIIKRGNILNTITSNYKNIISIIGTHGKTTTTSILVNIFMYNNINPGFINGGIMKNLEINSNIGNKNYFIIESDESDLSFLKLNSNITILTSIDDDHMNSYNNNIENLKNSFIKFINKSSNRIIILCNDDNNINSIINKIKNKKIYTYGFNKFSDFIIENYKQYFNYIKFKIINKKNNLNVNIIIKNLLGKHNALNAVASFIISYIKNMNIKKTIKSLYNFKGVKNRMDLMGKFNVINYKNEIKKNITIINDYGHHYNEIYQSYITCKNINNINNVIMIFQPHRFSRIFNLFKKFIEILFKVDIIILTKIFSANEVNYNNITSNKIFNELKKINRKNIFICKKNDFIIKILLKILNNNDVILFQGAGDIHKIFKEIINNNNKFIKI
ncbi:UDP-N-acetylmuramate--L-alanine ligase [endosymbiont of Euscepes postfasciatus]|uniref:UDP-N-acetylmuramate--L-alanine ligase n=1 Tax=endosymbiont of Euscepes postfasciatus TaxID=650377 RepID=UPI000DC70D85|nr:UDP-N-acetylmuramate--L-alanine ligase [endosymbiont of Euscepes postfasciatus]BBA84557.1 UDP-N-acetylmuramate--L-alanine ligase [endosymbiont of Euscepes postfasciatus]